MKLRIFILLFLFTLKNVTDLFGSILPSSQIIKLPQKKENIFTFIGMALGFLVFRNVKILFLTWHTGRRLWEEVSHVWEPYKNRKFGGGCYMQKLLQRLLNSSYCRNTFYLFTPFKRSHKICCSQTFWGIFSLNLVHPEQVVRTAETGQEIT